MQESFAAMKDPEMPVINLYSYRKRVADGEVPDTLIYDELPTTLRVQVVRILTNAIGPYHVYTGIEFRDVYENNKAWKRN